MGRIQEEPVRKSEKAIREAQARSISARPVRRTQIPKNEDRQQPIGIPVVEDKIVQKSTFEVLKSVYDVDFRGFSYGFRPGRSQHNALDAVVEAIEIKKVNWVLNAEFRGFIFLESQGEFLFSPSHKKQRLITSWSSIPLS
jgi:retron-type reverse transcriptase